MMAELMVAQMALLLVVLWDEKLVEKLVGLRVARMDSR